jgi:radical SAM protein with 4Fe4S-binding SPASM domain
MKKRQSKGYLDHLKHQTYKNKLKIINFNVKHNEKYSPYPLNAKIEINGSCNLDCIMCLRKALPNRDKFMSKKQFLTILDHIPSLIEWSPHGYNEPLLHPKFFDFVKETNNRNISLYLVTNGTVLNKTNINKLLKLEPRVIRFSIDAVGNKYEQIRKGADYNQVCSNIEYLMENNNGTEIALYSTIWKNNIDQIPLLKNLAEYFDIPINFAGITWKNEFGESNFDNKVEGFAIQQEKRKCTLPWNSIYIDVIGNCYPCTDTLQYLMGNVFTTHIKDIYNSSEFQDFRKFSLSGDNYECKNCIAWSPNY